MLDITLFMVVRNVSSKERLFRRVVETAARVSSSWYIVDHGSTDGTDAVIADLCRTHDIPCEYVHEPHDAGTMDEMKGKHYRIL